MHMFWRTSWEFFFPPTEAERRVFAATPKDVAEFYQPLQRGEHTTLSTYRHQLIQDLVTTNKFSTNRHAAYLLSLLLDKHLRSYDQPIILVPIPLSRARYQQRGHNQVMTVLRQLPQEDQVSPHKICKLLQRTRHTTPQTSLTRTDRYTNVNNAFTSTWQIKPLHASHICIIDDVVTTGSTLQAAKKTLETAYPNQTITTVALARSS